MSVATSCSLLVSRTELNVTLVQELPGPAPIQRQTSVSRTLAVNSGGYAAAAGGNRLVGDPR